MTRKRKKQKKEGKLFTIPVAITSVILGAILFISVFAGLIAPHEPNKVDMYNSLLKPFTPGYPLGTDQLGRDLLSRLICGARSSIINAFLIVAFEALLGIPIGLVCGYFGKKLDAVIMRIWDVVCSIPTLLLAFVLIAAFGKGTYSGIIAMGIVYTPLTAKLARSLMLTEKTQVYVEAAKSLGYSDKRIIFRHILPNCVTTMVTQLTLDIGSAISSMAGLSFLGLGVQPPQSDWGILLSEGMSMLYRSPILLLAPAVAIIITTISINIFSDGLQAYFDPAQRKLPSFKRYTNRLLRNKERDATWKKGLSQSGNLV